MSIRVSIRMPDRSAHLGSPTITLCRGPAAPNSEHTPLQRSILKSQHNPAPHRVGVKNVYFQKRCFSFLQERLYNQSGMTVLLNIDKFEKSGGGSNTGYVPQTSMRHDFKNMVWLRQCSVRRQELHAAEGVHKE